MELATLERHWRFDDVVGALVARRGTPQHFAIDALEQGHQSFLDWRPHDQHTATLLRGELSIVEVVAVLRDERPAKLSGEAVMLAVWRTPQFFVLEHEQHVPMQRLPHERDETCRH